MLKGFFFQIPLFLSLKLLSGENTFLIDSANVNLITDPPFYSGTLTIKVQPTDQADCKGNKATFSVVAEGGEGPIHYLWKMKRPGDSSFENFGARDSMKLPVYNIGTGNDAPDGTLFQVTVSDQFGAVLSDTARLTVNSISGIAPVGVATYTLNQGANLWFKVLTSGKTPTAYQWIKKQGTGIWKDLADNSIVTGSQQNQLNLNKLSLPDSGLYKLRVTFPTMNNNFCVETSTITRRVKVIPVNDTTPPIFSSPFHEQRILCPNDLELASWDATLGDIFPARKTFFSFIRNNTQFNLATTQFSDNITPSADLILHWGIYTTIHPASPISDDTGILLGDRTGQISQHPENFMLVQPETEAACCQIVYWLEDGAGNLTPDSLRYRIYISISRRPDIISSF